MYHVQHIGGWDLGSCVQVANEMVRRKLKSVKEKNVNFKSWIFCLGQPHPVKRRTIMCVDYKENALSDASCSNLKERPIETELCDIHLPYCEEDDNENSNMI